jgi:GNAT superfamily N-acetyltransferase
MNTRPEKLYQMLACPGSAVARCWYGVETLGWKDEQIVSADSPAFRRYLFGLQECIVLESGAVVISAPDHAPFALGALDIRKPRERKAPPIVERIYVTPERRRQGIATQLLQVALKDFPDLSLDGQLTDEGAALFGY